MIHTKLEVYRLAVDFSVQLYKSTEDFPPSEKFGLISQIRRAGVSIPANIAEGAARKTSKDYIHFIADLL